MIELVDFNNRWKDCFLNEKKILSNALKGQPVVEIEHIGATSVVLCKTAGTIDLLCSIQNKIEFITIKNILMKKGYQYIESLSNLDCYTYVRRNNKKQIIATVRVVEHASKTYKEAILFKYYLREKISHVKAYNKLRQTIIEEQNGNVEAYFKVKRNYIKSVINDFCKVD